MSIRIKLALQVSAIILFSFAFAAIPAFATGTNSNPPSHGHGDQEQEQGQGQGQEQGQSQEQSATSAATASNDGVTVGGDTSNVENNSSNVVLVPNNNTESCVRVWGIAFGRNSDSAALGIPWRSAKCDFEQAADDAFAAGERELGWFWKCHNKSLYKKFQSKKESAESATTDCHTAMVGGVTSLKTIDTLRAELRTSEELRELERNRNKDTQTKLNQLCEESKDRIAATCMKK